MGIMLIQKHGVTIKYHDQEITITSVQSATQATGNALATLKKINC